MTVPLGVVVFLQFPLNNCGNYSKHYIILLNVQAFHNVCVRCQCRISKRYEYALGPSGVILSWLKIKTSSKMDFFPCTDTCTNRQQGEVWNYTSDHRLFLLENKDALSKGINQWKGAEASLNCSSAQHLKEFRLVCAYRLHSQINCFISCSYGCKKATLGCEKKMTSQGNTIFPWVPIEHADYLLLCLVWESAIFMKLFNSMEDIMTVSPTPNALTSILFSCTS